MKYKADLDKIHIILVEPQIPENIGFAARAMTNMGLSHLHLVNPRNCDLSRVVKTATGPSIEVIEQMEVHEELRPALGPFSYVVGTTARTGSLRPALTDPRSLAQDLIDITQQNVVAILFGCEDRGLTNEDLKYCHTIATIPTSRFASLNLAHSVLLFAYEIFMAAREEKPKDLPRMANKFELEGMYDHLKEVLTKIGFLDPQNPEHWLLNIRRFLSRMPLRARDVRIIRGICRQIDWYTGQVEKGLKQKASYDDSSHT